MSKSVTQLELEITGKIQDFDKKVGELDSKLGALAKKGKAAPDSFGKGIGDMLPAVSKANIAVAALGAAFAVAAKGIGLAIEKQKSLAEFSAITGIVGADLEKFGDAADDLAIKFGTSALDNITSFKGVLSRLGPEFAQNADAVRLMGENINTLAVASGLDAAQSMDALTTAMLQFGVDLADPLAAANDAAVMMNIMAAGAKEGAAEIPQISEALVQAGVTAKNLGVSFVETNAAIQTLATGGKFGAEAGVALRNVMASMTKVSKLAADDLARYGLTAEELGNVLTTKGINAAMGLLNKAMQENGTVSEDAALMAALFGKENMAAAQVLAQNTALTDKYTTAIGGTNTANEQAATIMNTVSGRWAQVSAKVDVYVEKIGAFLLPAVEGIIKVFTDLIDNIERTGRGFGKLFEGDFSGAWDEFTGSVSDTNKELDTTSKKLRDTKTNAEDTTNSIVDVFRNVEVVTAELKAAQEAYNGAKSKEQMDIAGAAVKRLQAELDRLTGKTNKSKEAIPPLAGSVNALREQIKKLEEQQQSQTIVGSAAYEALGRQIIVLNVQLDTFVRMQKDAAAAATMTGIALKASSLSMEDLASAIAVNPMGELVDTMGTLDTSISTLDKFGLALDQTGFGVEALGGLFATAFSGADDAMKSVLKSILNNVITMVEGVILAGSAYASVSAIFTAGISAFKDAPLLAAAIVALEASRGFVNSFALGTPYVPQDMMARIHKGERVMNAEENQRYNAGQRMDGGRTGVLGIQRRKLDANVKIGFESFARAGAYSDFVTSRSIW